MKNIKYILLFSGCLIVFLLIGEIIFKDRIITVTTTGDVEMARSINYNSVVKFNSFSWMFDKVKSIFKSSDVVLINLEGPFVNKCQPTTERIDVFCGDGRHAQGLKQAGVNVVNLANNHSGDYGKEGTANTISLLKKEDILTVGPFSIPVTKEIKGVKFTFLSYDDIECDEPKAFCEKDDNIAKQIKKAKDKNGVLIVSFHWGVQYTSEPTVRQKYLAHMAVDSGADIVVGNHPHWIQPIENYHGKTIIYSHGNFVFDQQWSEKTREGIISRFRFYGNKLIKVEYIPIYINQLGQPEIILDKKKKDNILKNIGV